MNDKHIKRDLCKTKPPCRKVFLGKRIIALLLLAFTCLCVNVAKADGGTEGVAENRFCKIARGLIHFCWIFQVKIWYKKGFKRVLNEVKGGVIEGVKKFV